jgi:hypothetical protein
MARGDVGVGGRVEGLNVAGLDCSGWVGCGGFSFLEIFSSVWLGPVSRHGC